MAWRPIRQLRNSLNRKLILFFVVLLFSSLMVLGATGYYISQRALDDKGEIILKNSVLLALELIELEYQRYEDGEISAEEAQ